MAQVLIKLLVETVNAHHVVPTTQAVVAHPRVCAMLGTVALMVVSPAPHVPQIPTRRQQVIQHVRLVHPITLAAVVHLQGLVILAISALIVVSPA